MDEGLKNLIEKAEKGDVEAMIMVGDCYNRGFHTDRDDSKAQAYYQMAADKGNFQAAFMVATGYLNGIGVEKDKANAKKYMEYAAQNGVANAQYVLGTMYKTGVIGNFFREEKAIYYFEKAAKQGHAKAQIELGDINILNEGFQYNFERGLFWIVCAYLHGESALTESNEAVKRMNSLIKSGIPGGRDRFDKIIEKVNKKYSSYTKNPQ